MRTSLILAAISGLVSLSSCQAKAEISRKVRITETVFATSTVKPTEPEFETVYVTTVVQPAKPTIMTVFTSTTVKPAGPKEKKAKEEKGKEEKAKEEKAEEEKAREEKAREEKAEEEKAREEKVKTEKAKTKIVTITTAIPPVKPTKKYPVIPIGTIIKPKSTASSITVGNKKKDPSPVRARLFFANTAIKKDEETIKENKQKKAKLELTLKNRKGDDLEKARTNIEELAQLNSDIALAQKDLEKNRLLVQCLDLALNADDDAVHVRHGLWCMSAPLIMPDLPRSA